MENRIETMNAALVELRGAFVDLGLALRQAMLATTLSGLMAIQCERDRLRHTWRRALGRKLAKGSCGLLRERPGG
jgi:hypothetical protein